MMLTTTPDVTTPQLLFLGGLLHSLTRYVALVWLGRRRLKSFVKVGYISGLFYYPLKSGRGIELKEAIATGVGLSHNDIADRHWMIVDQNQAFVSQRKEPRIVLMAVDTIAKGSTIIRIDAPEMEPLFLPKSPRIEPSSKILKCRIFSHWVNALDCGDAAAEWVSTFLKRPNLRLVVASGDLEMAELASFSEDPEEAVQPGDKVAFADFASYLIINQTSVDYINAKIDQPVNVLNYRPNIVIGGCLQAFEEETWMEVRVGKDCHPGSVFRCLHLCSRCVMTTVDRDTGVKDADRQPLNSLKAIRGVPQNQSVKFGVNATLNGQCNLNIGDPVYVLFRHNRDVLEKMPPKRSKGFVNVILTGCVVLPLFALSKEPIPHVTLHEFKKNPGILYMQRKKSSQNTDDGGVATERTCMRPFSRSRKAYYSRKDESRECRLRGLDYDALEAAADANPTVTVWELSTDFNVNHTTIYRELKRLGKVTAVRKWVPHDLSADNCKQNVDCCAPLSSVSCKCLFE